MDGKLAVKSVIKLLNSYKIKSFVCGGTARDLYLKNNISNMDIAVDVNLKTLRDIFNNRITSINEYGLYVQLEYKNNIFYIYPLKKIELVNTYYNFSFTKSIKEDSSTRDFTINSIYYDSIKNKWIDYNNGMSDIDNKIIRFIGDPHTRILESKIRLLRAPALLGILGAGWKLDNSTKCWIKNEKLKILTASNKQINKEFTNVLIKSKKPSVFFYSLKELGILEILLPELHYTLNIEQTNKASNLNLFQHIMYTLDNIPNNLDKENTLILRLAALLHDIGKPFTQTSINGNMHFYQHEYVGKNIAENILYRLGFNAQIINKVKNLILNHLFESNSKSSIHSIKKLIHRVGPDNIYNLLELRSADRLGNHRTDISMKEFNKFKQKVNKVLEKEYPKHFKLAVTDNDLLNILSTYTDRQKDSLQELKDHIKLLIKIKKLLNNKTRIIEYLNKLFSIKCPLDTKHLINTWSNIHMDNAEVFQNGNVKCGLYCNFICNDKVKTLLYNKK